MPTELRPRAQQAPKMRGWCRIWCSSQAHVIHSAKFSISTSRSCRRQIGSPQGACRTPALPPQAQNKMICQQKPPAILTQSICCTEYIFDLRSRQQPSLLNQRMRLPALNLTLPSGIRSATEPAWPATVIGSRPRYQHSVLSFHPTSLSDRNEQKSPPEGQEAAI